ncbi:RtcB family protein [Aneurinibacillus uraniidurans]|uniref:RtcB family protein n=1 Tax=Aneurinibacillus uraniidurans TaxID=2966586 RepID=UPI002349AB23|nr:RtcB family protein [Aneurinibacillus sp. B1]WCN36397.1 RtcB family protein [Aneurinibacillus sp. B1]
MSIIDHGNNHKETKLKHGSLHIFANETVFDRMESRIFEMADNNLRIPRVQYMSYTPDAHVGVGTCIGTTAVWSMNDGFVSPSIVGVDIGCGMRVHLTNLTKDDIQDKSTRRAMIDAIEKYVPTNEKTTSNYDDVNLKDVLTEGVHALPEKYYIDGMSDRVETSKFNYNKDYLNDVPEKSWARAKGQLGTLGGGNHFIELQAIEIDPKNRETAEKWGLFDGQIVIMIHSGSRAWGASLGRIYTNSFKAIMGAWGVSNPDPQLVYAPVNTQEGQQYINLMYSALNFAVTNRHLIAYGVQKGISEALNKEVRFSVLYDLMHNYALKEFHQNQPMLVHRKGATRALPAGHFLNPKAYKETGHPALIPGSMATASYIMVGKDAGVKNFYSICHGAGRVRSRKATKQMITVDEFSQSMKVGTDEEILVNHRTLDAILDECPQAYKDVDQIIDSIVGANLAEVVAKCHPMAVLKAL